MKAQENRAVAAEAAVATARTDLDAERIVSNTFELEWPPHSGKTRIFPEVDRAEWFDLPTARTKINERQRSLLDELEALLG